LTRAEFWQLGRIVVAQTVRAEKEIGVTSIVVVLEYAALVTWLA
jgi:hypothetical protein